MVNISSDEAIFILATLGRVVSYDEEWYDENYVRNLMDKLGYQLMPDELHWANKVYMTLKFSPHGDPTPDFLEIYRS